MEKRISLLELFELISEDLRQELGKITLPHDACKLESILNDIFTRRIDISKYYSEISPTSLGVLQHCFRIIAIQNRMFSCFNFPDENLSTSCSVETLERENNSKWKSLILDNKEVAATFLGGIIGGGWIISSWGSIIVATIACAIAKYYNTNPRSNQAQTPHAKSTNLHISLNVDLLIDIARDLCQQIDDMMQYVQDSIDALRKKEEPVPIMSLDNDFSELLDSIKNLFLSYSRDESTDKLKMMVQDVFDTLENYDYQILDYSDEYSCFFNVVESPHISKAQTSKPAILKGGELLEKGRYLVPSDCKTH